MDDWREAICAVCSSAMPRVCRHAWHTCCTPASTLLGRLIETTPLYSSSAQRATASKNSPMRRRGSTIVTSFGAAGAEPPPCDLDAEPLAAVLAALRAAALGLTSSDPKKAPRESRAAARTSAAEMAARRAGAPDAGAASCMPTIPAHSTRATKASTPSVPSSAAQARKRRSSGV